MDKNIKCLVLFGSHARGDHDLHSDIDLLGIDNSYDYGVTSIKTTNLSLYSEEKLTEMMAQGDLFALHLKEEGICIFNDEIFNVIKKSFKYKDDYSSEIYTSYLLAKKILEREAEIKDWAFANRRISWCIRTFLISLSAEKRTPFFSKKAMSTFANDISNKTINKLSFEDQYFLIDAKAHSSKNEKILTLLSIFLHCFSEFDDENKITKRVFYSSGVVCNTLESLFHDLKNYYE
ncbi:hypothetical protein VH86_01780 [Pantoea sp. BL1]|uniref:nucleotidyltransferase domain-containing protein n=1 Tax=Pantoea sp. BL1 TaxID=1628190 RepID=UPI0005F77944|nr:nucleotidyltransferase domain-containing protein [Pantoea sp. BL1]KJV49916.1 hypothetical protein VH86_01780 [Pantoea sp. BL1]